MRLHHELLALARHILDITPETPATLRRAVSTAYYALFHLLIYEACLNWSRPEQRSNLVRVFEHKHMFTVSDQRRASYMNSAKKSVEGRLFQVAFSFVQLQQQREFADYDSSFQISRDQGRLAVDRAELAFGSWQHIRDKQIAHDYLFSLLIRERPVKSLKWE